MIFKRTLMLPVLAVFLITACREKTENNRSDSISVEGSDVSTEGSINTELAMPAMKISDLEQTPLNLAEVSPDTTFMPPLNNAKIDSSIKMKGECVATHPDMEGVYGNYRFDFRLKGTDIAPASGTVWLKAYVVNSLQFTVPINCAKVRVTISSLKNTHHYQLFGAIYWQHKGPDGKSAEETKLLYLGYTNIFKPGDQNVAMQMKEPSKIETPVHQVEDAPEGTPVCDQNYSPVCGQKNGVKKTYSNQCFLTADQATKLNDGVCVTETTPEPVDGSYSILYPSNWTPGYKTKRPSDQTEMFVHDFSYAGYKYGEVDLPTGDATQAINVTGTNCADIQTAIDQAALKGGGLVTVGEGEFNCTSGLVIKNSNIILKGAGSGKTKLWISSGSALYGIRVYSGNEYISYDKNDNWDLAADSKVFDTFVELKDATGLAVGDYITIHTTTNQAMVDAYKAYAHGSTSAAWGLRTKGNAWPNHRREISKIEGNKVYFKVPLRHEIKAVVYEAHVRRVKPTHFRVNIGIQGLSIHNTRPTLQEAYAAGPDIKPSAIYMQLCTDCWIKDVKSYARTDGGTHLWSNGVVITESMRVTVEDVTMEKAQNRGEGSHGYMIEPTLSNEVLFRRVAAREGRHNLVPNWGMGNSGLVFTYSATSGGWCNEAYNTDPYYCGYSEMHGQLAMGVLFDNVTVDDNLVVGNRGTFSRAGHTATDSVLWNLKGTGEIYSFAKGMGYVVGTAATLKLATDPSTIDTTMSKDGKGWAPKWAEHTQPYDFTDFIGQGDKLLPQSLYSSQLAKRLGN
ncbi:hypothetical protein MEO40_19270 [Dolichospermum sp. ST_sed1]|nr:hypothetical protein [Dolichospermum sp. ST_sed1]